MLEGVLEMITNDIQKTLLTKSIDWKMKLKNIIDISIVKMENNKLC